MNLSFNYKSKFFLFFLLAVDFYLLLLSSNSLSIGYYEALNYFVNFNELSILTNISTSIFGQNNIALRLPFILFHLASVILLYILTKDFFKYEIDRVVSIIIFTLLPGINGAALLTNTSVLVIFTTLLYLCIYKRKNKHSILLLIFALFLDNSFAILFLAIFFYTIYKKDTKIMIYTFILFLLSLYLYGFDTGGKPQGYFLDIIGVYSSIFSPLLFLYFFYAMYKIGTKGEKTLWWFISFTALGFSILLSFRQQITIEDFAPFVVIAIPIMVKLFLSSLRVRLPIFRKKHHIFIYIVAFSLIFNFIILLYNKPIYLFIQNPKKHFAYDYHIVQELAQKLKDLNISGVSTKDKRLALRLRFYNIAYDDKYILSKTNQNGKKISINYYNRNIINFNLISQ